MRIASLETNCHTFASVHNVVPILNALPSIPLEFACGEKLTFLALDQTYQG
jgi:hypothetical protein